MRLRSFVWHDDLYEGFIHLVLGPAKAAKRRLDRCDMETGKINWNVGGLTMEFEDDGHYDTVIWFPSFRVNSTSDMAMLAHECFHVTHNTMQRAGLPLSHTSREAFAYHLGWIYRECLKRLKNG